MSAGKPSILLAFMQDVLLAFRQSGLLAGTDFPSEKRPKHCLGKMSDNQYFILA
jgi:hypothetical protein